MPDFDTRAIRARLELAGRQAREGARLGLEEAAEHLLGVALTRVPLEEGTLARSGKVSTDPGALRAAVSFKTPYAVRQHEELDYKHDPGRTAKYLEGPMHEEKDVLTEIIGARVRGEMER